MPDVTSPRWLPVDIVLGAEVSAATDAALAPLAAHARRIRRTAIVGTSILLGPAVALAILAATPGEQAWAFLAVAFALFAFLLAVRAHRQWDGDELAVGNRGGRMPVPDPTIDTDPANINVGNRGGRMPVPDLPEAAAKLLADLRSGARRARYRRAQSGRDVTLPPQQMRGPFGALLLSSSPTVQSLALRDWLGGDQLSVEIETIEREWPLSTVVEVSEAANETGKAEHPLGLDHRLFMRREALGRLLDTAYPPVSRGARESLIVDALMLGNELVAAGLLPDKIKTLVSRIVAGLKAPDGRPVHLVADDGSVARAGYRFQHRKAVEAGYARVGLREGSDSSAWIEQVVTGRYADIRERLDATEEQYRAR